MVKEYGSSPVTMRPHPVIQSDVLDEEGNLRPANIWNTWEDNETFLHGVRVVGPGPPRPTGMGPVMSTPYEPTREHDRDNTSTMAQPPTPFTRDTSGISTGGTHPVVQQQVPELAGMVLALPGGR